MPNLRQQLKHDRSRVVANEAVHWTQEHRTTILVTLIGALIVAAIVLGLYTYQSRRDDQASVALGNAMHILNSQVRQAGQPAEPGTTSYASAAERDKAALDAFEGISAKYPNTTAGKYSLYMAGVVQASEGDNGGAEKSFQRARDEGNATVSSLAKLALANLYASEKRDADAIKLYRDLIDNPTTVVSKSAAQISLAEFYEDRNQTADALKLYEQVQKDNPKNALGEAAQQKISTLNTGTAAPARK